MSNKNPYYDATSNLQLNIAFNRLPLSEALDFHFHESYEIYLCLTDKMTYLVNTQAYNLSIGDLLVFNSNDIHKSLPPSQGPYARNIVQFTPEYIESLSTPQTDLLECFHNHSATFNHRIHLDEKNLQAFNQLLEEAKESLNLTNYGSDLVNKMYLAKILLFINNAFHSNESYTPHATPYPHGINELIVYLHTHFNDHISLDHLAKQFGLNKNQLNKNFKESTGYTINQYLIHYRILIAKRYLKQDETVSITAEKVGFNNLSHFIRTFHSIVGLSPKQYTKQASPGITHF